MNEESGVARIVKEAESSGFRVIAVAGGSCTGKSTFIASLEKALSGNAAVIHLDGYQKGRDWKGRNTSVYGWDDPDHFSLPEFEQDVRRYLDGHAVSVPCFSLKTNGRAGSTEVVQKRFLVLEGLYVLPPYINDIPAVGVYLEAPFFVRLIRRIVRFITEVQPEDIRIPLRHMVMNTYPAHMGLVKRQRDGARVLIESTYSRSSVHALLEKMPVFPKLQGAIIHEWSFFEGRLKFLIRRSNGGLFFTVEDEDAVRYCAKIEEEWKEGLLKIDMLSV